MSDIPEDPPDENEAYENLDEARDAGDLPGGEDTDGYIDVEDLVADRRALHEAGADLDDPERYSLLDGGMDDPDGPPPPDPRPHRSGSRPAGDDEPTDPELEIIDVDPALLEQVPDDAPGPDAARW